MKELPTIEVTGTLDIETEHWDGFILGGIYDKENEYRPFGWWQEGAYVDAILSLEGTYWSHNGGRFDLLHLLEHFRRRKIKDVKIHLAGQRITNLQVGSLSLRDSAALAPMRLKKFAQIGNYDKAETGFDCICGKACGGHCKWGKDMSPADWEKGVEYNKYDCLSLFSALTKLKEFAATNGIALAGTVGASAWKTISHTLNVERADWSNPRGSASSYYNAVSRARFGGRCQVFRPKAPRGFRYDMNSAYPAALTRIQLPIGKAEEKWGSAASRYYAKGGAGVYMAKVEVPKEMFIPPLPYRTQERIAYPIGVVDGVWMRRELEYAESVGVRILSINSAMIWNDTFPVLKPFCEHIWKLRHEAGPKTALGQWLKWLANSLTGKLGQNPLAESIIMCPKKVKYCPARAMCTGSNKELMCSRSRGCCKHRCWGTCGVYLPIDQNGSIFSKKDYRIPDCGYIHWAADLLADTRIELHRQTTDDGEGGLSALYNDTDSCYATKPRAYHISDDELGWWKYEGELEDWEALAPKTYRYSAPTEKGLIPHAASKGIPEALEAWGAISTRQPVLIDRGVRTLKTAIKKGESLFVRKHMERIVSPDGIHFGDRILREDGRTYPQSIEELTAM